MRVRFLILFFSLLIISKFTFAIGDDSTYHRYNPNWTRYFHPRYPDYTHALDTSITLFHEYDFLQQQFGWMNLGSNGTPAYQTVYHSETSVGLKWGMEKSISPYLFTPENIKFYNTLKPYTNLFYTTGSKAEQQLVGTHTQNFGRNVNLGFEFVRQGVPGFYQRQRADIFDLDVFADVRSNNQRYEISPYIIMNKLQRQLNGGATEQNIFTDSTLIDKNLAAVNLNNAEAEFRSRHYGAYQSYSWGNSYVTKLNDTSFQSHFNSSVRLLHHIDYSESRYNYRDDSLDFPFYYNKYYLNADSTNDTSYYSVLHNEISLSLNDTKHVDSSSTINRKFSSKIFLTHDLHKFSYHTSAFVNEFRFGFEASGPIPMKHLYSYMIAYAGTTDRNELEYFFNAYLTYSTFSNDIDYFLNVQSTQTSASWSEQHYYSNHYFWNNSFTSPIESFAELGFYNAEKNNLSAGVKYLIHQNPIYFSANAEPTQYNGTLKGWCIYAKKNFRFGKIHLDNEIGINLLDEKVFSLPVYVGKHSLYYQNSLFKHALDFCSGIEVNYVSDYYAPAFNPAMLSFYQQNETLMHYYPVADFFVNMKIKSARIFLRIENIDQNLFEPGYFTFPSYPAADRSFKFGVSWMFWN